MKTETYPFILDVPVLDDETVDALHSFLQDLLTQFENHYFGQLHRHQQHLASIRREAVELNARTSPHPPDPDAALDDELNDADPF